MDVKRINSSIEQIIREKGSFRSPYENPAILAITGEFEDDKVSITYEADMTYVGLKTPNTTITVAVPRKDDPGFYNIVYEYEVTEDALTEYVPGEWQGHIIALGEFAKLSEMQRSQASRSH